MALKAGLELRFLTLAGDGKVDPDLLFLERGLAAYDEVRLAAKSAMTFACRATLPDPLTASAELKSRAAQTVFEIIANAESEVTRSEFVNETASHLRLPLAAAQKDFQTFLQRQSRQSAARPAANTPEPAPAVPHTAHTPERDLLLLCLHFETIGKPLSLSIPHDWIDLGHPAGALLNRFLGEFEHDLWPGKDHLENLLESDAERSLVASLLFETPGFEEPTKVAQEGLKLLRARALEPRLREIELALANPHADIESDPISLLKERSELHRLLRQPIALAASA
jgi:DNA primase